MIERHTAITIVSSIIVQPRPGRGLWSECGRDGAWGCWVLDNAVALSNTNEKKARGVVQPNVSAEKARKVSATVPRDIRTLYEYVSKRRSESEMPWQVSSGSVSTMTVIVYNHSILRNIRMGTSCILVNIIS